MRTISPEQAGLTDFAAALQQEVTQSSYQKRLAGELQIILQKERADKVLSLSLEGSYAASRLLGLLPLKAMVETLALHVIDMPYM